MNNSTEKENYYIIKMPIKMKEFFTCFVKATNQSNYCELSCVSTEDLI